MHAKISATPPTAAGPQVVVYFDDDCGFCVRCCRWAAHADRRQRLLFLGAGDAARHLHDLSGYDLDASIVAVDSATGRKAIRSRAAAMILRALPPPWSWLRWLGVPPFTVISDRIYDHVARHRRRLSRALGEPECAVPAHAPQAGGPETEKPCA